MLYLLLLLYCYRGEILDPSFAKNPACAQVRETIRKIEWLEDMSAQVLCKNQPYVAFFDDQADDQEKSNDLYSLARSAREFYCHTREMDIDSVAKHWLGEVSKEELVAQAGEMLSAYVWDAGIEKLSEIMQKKFLEQENKKSTQYNLV